MNMGNRLIMQQNLLQVQTKFDLTKGFKWNKNTTKFYISENLHHIIIFKFNSIIFHEKSIILPYICLHANLALPRKTRIHWANLSQTTRQCRTMEDYVMNFFTLGEVGEGESGGGGLGVGIPWHWVKPWLSLEPLWTTTCADHICWAAVHGDHYIIGTVPGAEIGWVSM